MAGKKEINPAQEEVKQEAPVMEPENTETSTQEEVKQEKAYKFKSENPYLTVAFLGVQFREGKYQTTNLEVAKALAKVGGVELIEE